MKNKIIIGLVGTLASGKGAVKEYLINNHEAKGCKFSDIFRDVLNRLNIPITRDNLQKVSTSLRSNFGEDLLSKTIISDVGKIDSKIVIVDGIRRFTDMNNLKNLPNFFILAVDADSKLRYERMKARNENEGDSSKTYEDFLKDENAEADRQIPEVIKTADFLIENNGTLEDLHRQIDKIIEKINK